MGWGVTKIVPAMFALAALTVPLPAVAEASAGSAAILSSDEAFLVRHPWVCIGTSGFYDAKKPGSPSTNCVEKGLTFRPDRTLSITEDNGTAHGGMWRLSSSAKEQTILTMTQTGGPDLTFVVFFYLPQDSPRGANGVPHELAEISSGGLLPPDW